MSDKFSEAKYDERQTAVRGRAFKYAYGTLLVALFVYFLSDMLWPWCVPAVGCISAIAASLVPLAWVSIRNEAFWWAESGRKAQYVVFALVGVMNLLLAFDSWRDGDLIVDGVLQTGGANLILGVLFVYVFAVAMVQRARAPGG